MVSDTTGDRTTIIGIDPGQAGAIVSLGRGGAIMDLRVMPAAAADLASYLAACLQWAGPTAMHVWLEAAQSFPKQGIVSAFNYGTHYGELRGVLIALKVPFTLVRPIIWTKTMHSGTKAKAPAKARSLEAARRLQPSERWIPDGVNGKKPHEGFVDAYLLAEYGRRQMALEWTAARKGAAS